MSPKSLPRVAKELPKAPKRLPRDPQGSLEIPKRPPETPTRAPKWCLEPPLPGDPPKNERPDLHETRARAEVKLQYSNENNVDPESVFLYFR